METESSYSQSDVLSTDEATPKIVELKAVEVLPCAEEDGEDSSFSTNRKPKKKQIKNIKDESFSTKLESAVEPGTLDAEPIVEKEEDSSFSTKCKPKKTQVHDVASREHSMTIEQVELKPSIEEEIDIEPDITFETEQITIESGVVAKPRKKSIKKIAEEAQSGDSTPSNETRTVETEAITIESGVVAKPRKMSIKKTADDRQSGDSIPIKQETSTVTRKKSEKKSSKSDQSEESVEVLNRRPSSKL